MPADIQRIVMDQLACWRIRRGDAEVLIAEQGAQVLSYRQGEIPVIWLSEEAAFTQGQPVRGGVPICWPWFGDLSRNPDEVRAMYQGEAEAPFHGLVRNLNWQLTQQSCEGDSGMLEFTCPQALGELPGWPQRVELSLQVCLNERLHISLTSHNRGDRPVAISQALHSYFAVGDIQQVSVQGLDGRRYIETLEDWQQRQQQGDLKIKGETDRIYLELPPVLQLLDPSWKRRISLETSGSHSAILWNPWVDKAQRLSQFADDAWQRMLCIETANAMDDRILLEAGATHTLGVSIGSESL